MEKNNKQLLIRDICARLPYGVYVKFKQYNEPLCLSVKDRLSIYNGGELINNLQYLYLRPMSSMTEEEKDYIKNVARFKQSDGIHYDDGVHYVPIYQETLDDQWKTDGKFPPILGDIYRFMLDYGYILLIDFFNSHHIDYRGLIEKGLALEAPEGMYSIKTE